MKKIFAIAVAAIFAVSASAQDCCQKEGQGCCGGFAPNWFVQFQGGVQLPNTPGMGDLTSPVWSLNIGRNITPMVSARIGIEGLNSRVYNAFSGDEQKFQYATGSFDAMLDLVKLFGGKCCTPVSFYALGGVGLNWSGMETTNSSKFSPNVRLGAMLDWRVAKNLSLNLEYRADNTNDQFNGRLEPGTHDWYTSLLLGVSLQIPNSSAKVKAQQERIGELQKQYDAALAENAELKAQAARAEAAVAKAQAETRAARMATAAKAEVKEEAPKASILPAVFFQCANSKVQTNQKGNVEQIAKFMKENADAQIIIKGYASPEGGSKANQKLSEKRAKAVADMLVKKYGIAADRIFTEGCGETDAMFSERNLNRVAVSEQK